MPNQGHDPTGVDLERVTGFAAERTFTGGYTVVATIEDRADLRPKVELAFYRDDEDRPVAPLAHATVLILTENLPTYRRLGEVAGERDVHFSMEDVCAAATIRVAASDDKKRLTYRDSGTVFFGRSRVVGG